MTEPHRESDEFSIEVYMSQLLQRVGGKPKAAAPAVEFAGRHRSCRVRCPSGPRQVPATNTPRAPVSPATPAAELLPRAKPLPLDLDALRDVANQTARSAIERHTSRIWLQAAAGKWFGAAVALIAAIGLSLLVDPLLRTVERRHCDGRPRRHLLDGAGDLADAT